MTVFVLLETWDNGADTPSTTFAGVYSTRAAADQAVNRHYDGDGDDPWYTGRRSFSIREEPLQTEEPRP